MKKTMTKVKKELMWDRVISSVHADYKDLLNDFHGKDINYVKPQNGLNVLMSYLSYARKPEAAVVDEFVKKGINVNQVDSLSMTALLYAAINKHVTVPLLKHLVDAGADTKARNAFRQNALHLVVVDPEINGRATMSGNARPDMTARKNILDVVTYLHSAGVNLED